MSAETDTLRGGSVTVNSVTSSSFSFSFSSSAAGIRVVGDSETL